MKEQIYNGDWKEFCKIQKINPVFEHGTSAYTNLMYKDRRCQINCSEFELDSDHLWLTITKEGNYICGVLSPYEPYIAPSDDVEFIIEQNTNYSKLIQQIHSINFNTIRELSVRTIKSFSQKKQQVLFRLLDQGTTIVRLSYSIEYLKYLEVCYGDFQLIEDLREVEEYEGLNGYDVLEEYMFAYGQMHQAKLDFVFQKLYDDYSDIFNEEEINIIDYGCGQAIGTMCYADFLKKHGITQKIKSITLIEPSVLSLERAALHVSLFFPDAKIITRNKYIYELDEDDFICTQSLPTLHIFSNTLDVLDSHDLTKLYSLFNETTEGFNQFVCVGPLFKDIVRDDTISGFAGYVNGENVIEGVLEKNELKKDKDWTCNYSCFSIKSDNHYDHSINDAEYLYNRGLRYRYGYAFERDPQKAFECFKKSAELECAKAQYELGVIYAEGFGVERNDVEAARWFTKAAEHGCEDALYALGMCYLQAKGEKRDLFKAYNMFKRASILGNKKAEKTIHCVDDTFAIPQRYSLRRGPIPYEEFKKLFNQGSPLIYRETNLGHRYSLICCYSQKGGFSFLVPVYINEIPSSSDDVFAEIRNTDGKLPFVFVYKKDDTIQNENDLPF